MTHSTVTLVSVSWSSAIATHRNRMANRIEIAKIFFARYAREAPQPLRGNLNPPISDARGVGGFTLVAPPREELQDKTRCADLFKEGVWLTEWHRTADQQVSARACGSPPTPDLCLPSPFFCAQVVSLKLIAQEMLRSTPAHLERAIELSVPGSLLQQNLEFQAPVVLYASPNSRPTIRAQRQLRTSWRVDSRIFGCVPFAVLASVRAV
eukprot:4996086-Prymnesium_polylepis.1